MITGIELKGRLGLDYFSEVKIAKILINNLKAYIIFYDSDSPNHPITKKRVLSHPRPSLVYTYPFKDPKILYFIDLHNFQGSENSLFFVVDLAGKYYNSDLFESFTESKLNLLEFTTIKDLNKNAFSDITKKYAKLRDKEGNTGSYLMAVKWNQRYDYLTIYFKIRPTYDSIVLNIDKNSREYKADHYKLIIRFLNVSKELGSKEDFLSFKKGEQKRLILEMLNKCYCQVWSSSPSFYYQGSWEGLDRVGAVVYPFNGVPGKDIWIKRHGLEGIHLSKHFKEAFRIIFNNADVIARKIRRE